MQKKVLAQERKCSGRLVGLPWKGGGKEGGEGREFVVEEVQAFGVQSLPLTERELGGGERENVNAKEGK